MATGDPRWWLRQSFSVAFGSPSPRGPHRARHRDDPLHLAAVRRPDARSPLTEIPTETMAVWFDDESFEADFPVDVEVDEAAE